MTKSNERKNLKLLLRILLDFLALDFIVGKIKRKERTSKIFLDFVPWVNGIQI